MLPSALRNARYTQPSAPVRARIMHIEQANPDRLVILSFSVGPKAAPLLDEHAICSHVAALTSGLGSTITCQNARTLPLPSAVRVAPSTPDMAEMVLGASNDLPSLRLRE